MATWKLWILLGLGLAILEVILPAQFLLVALGTCAIIVGVLAWTLELSMGAQLAWFAALAIVLVPVFVFVWRRKAPVRYAGTAGEAVSAPQIGRVESLEPLTIRLHSDRFPAANLGTDPLSVGDAVRVEGFSGITASVRKHPAETA